MQSIKLSIIETITTLLTDNINNLIVFLLAVYVYSVPMSSCLPLFLVGNSLNALTTYARRRMFNRIKEQ